MAFQLLIEGEAIQSTPAACVVDIVAPTFSGITSVTPNSDGSFTTAWGAVSGGSTPYRFEIFILPGAVSAATLFASSPADYAGASPRRTYVDSNGDPMTKGEEYTLGVRVRSATNNLNTNTVVLTSTAIGSVNLAQVLQDLQTSLAGTEDDLAQDVLDLEAAIASDVSESLKLVLSKFGGGLTGKIVSQKIKGTIKVNQTLHGKLEDT